jgi:hypothetical protein
MERLIKLIWDFKGLSSQQIAKHHAIHLKEYGIIEKLPEISIGFETISDMHSIAYMVVSEENMIKVRDVLKPHRGTSFEEK